MTQGGNKRKQFTKTCLLLPTHRTIPPDMLLAMHRANHSPIHQNSHQSIKPFTYPSNHHLSIKTSIHQPSFPSDHPSSPPSIQTNIIPRKYHATPSLWHNFTRRRQTADHSHPCLQHSIHICQQQSNKLHQNEPSEKPTPETSKKCGNGCEQPRPVACGQSGKISSKLSWFPSPSTTTNGALTMKHQASQQSFVKKAGGP